MSVTFNHLYIRSNVLCDLKTLYYQTRQNIKACGRVCINIVRKIQSICCMKQT